MFDALGKLHLDIAEVDKKLEGSCSPDDILFLCLRKATLQSTYQILQSRREVRHWPRKKKKSTGINKFFCKW